MNTKIIGIVGGIIIIIGVVLWLTIGRGPAQRSSNQPSGAPIVEESQSTSGLTSLKALLALGRPQACEFSRNDKGEETSGVIYTAGKQMRGDFDSLNEGKTMRTHMIVDGETLYTWVDESGTGLKMGLNATPEGDRSSQGVNVDEQLDYRCRAWSADSSLFRLPDGVEFTDFSAMLPSAGTPAFDAKVPAVGNNENITDTSAQQCAACDGVPEPARSQCRVALGCR
jgi:hypothetical protein